MKMIQYTGWKATWLVCMLLAACGKDAPTVPTPVVEPPVVVVPPTTPPTTQAKTYLALGDSYTIGQNVSVDQRFPAQTVAFLRQYNININNPQYVATSGWTTVNLMNAINTATLTPPYSVVSLLIGVNDQYQTRDTTNYRTRFTGLLNKAIELAGNQANRVFVLSIPDYSATPFVPQSAKAQVRKEIDWFNAINKSVCDQRGISYTDITPSTREALDKPSLISSDSLHPSGLEYQKWADMLALKMKVVLE